MDDKIEYLSKDKYRGYRLPMDYTTEEYFDVSLVMKDNYFKIEMEKKDSSSQLSTVKKNMISPINYMPNTIQRLKLTGFLKTRSF